MTSARRDAAGTAETAIVLGAGIVGVSCALALQRRGLAVTLIDRRPPGSETSFGNAGIISGSSLLPLNHPGLWRSLPGYLGNRHAAVRYRLGHLLGEPGWILRFLAEARPARLAPRVAALGSLASRALALHRAWMAEAGVSHRLRETGTLELWRSGDGAAARDRQSWLAAHGVATQLLDAAGIAAVEPGLNPVFAHGILLPGNGSVDWPQAVVAAYAALFSARGGTILQEEIAAAAPTASGWAVTTAAGRRGADHLVVALGPWSGDLLRPLGYRVPLGVERGYHRHYRAAPGRGVTRPILDIERSYMMTPMERGHRVSTGVELAARDAPDDHAQIELAAASAREAVDLVEPVGEIWRGARPTLPDSLPMIGAAPRHRGLWLAFGNQHVGFSTGPITAEILAALVCGAPPPADPAPFAPARYLG